ncbi:hypothetical protein Z957_05130 [Clostridium sp. K25]|uniref:hypothetical protein n=1 Tax=Clostridium sp. K25 TaxID=1443109 RepID=UPI0004D5A490|nr:hypothetical protein [Clostridium sp. K25]KEI09290.1 hypothetical protein Z957_05130 [Clostridium sp. K25]
MIRTIIYSEINGIQEIIYQRISDSEKIISNDNIKILQVKEKEEYNNIKKFHIEDKKIVIDEVYEKELTKEEKLEKELLETKATLVDLKYKEVIERTEKVGRQE